MTVVDIRVCRLGVSSWNRVMMLWLPGSPIAFTCVARRRHVTCGAAAAGAASPSAAIRDNENAFENAVTEPSFVE